MFTATFPYSTACPVAPLAKEAARLIRQMARHDGVSPDLWNAANARLSAVEACAVTLAASSPDGAYLQACIAYGCAEAIWSWVDPDLQDAAETSRRMVEGASLSLARAMAVPELAALADYYLPAAAAAEVAA